MPEVGHGPKPDHTRKLADPSIIVERSPQDTVTYLYAAAAAAAGPKTAIGLLHIHPDFKAGADRMLSHLWRHMEVIESSEVEGILTEVRRRSSEILFILAEVGHSSRAGLWMASKLEQERKDAADYRAAMEGGESLAGLSKGVETTPPLILVKRDPGQGGVATDVAVDKHLGYRQAEALMVTPFTVDDMQIAVAEALMRKGEIFPGVNKLASNKVIEQLVAMSQVLFKAWKDFLKHPIIEKGESLETTSLCSSAEAKLLYDLLGEVETAIELLGEAGGKAALETETDVANDTLAGPLRNLRKTIGQAISQLSIVLDLMKMGQIKMPLDYQEAIRDMQVQIANLLELIQTMRSAYRDNHRFTWYRILKMLESPEYFRPLKDYHERTGAIQGILNYMEEESLALSDDMRSKLDEIESTTGGEENQDQKAMELEIWREMQSTCWTAAETAGRLGGEASFVELGELKHHLLNKLSPLVSFCETADVYMESFTDEQKSALKEIVARIFRLVSMAPTLTDGLKSTAAKGSLLKKLTEMIAAARSQQTEAVPEENE